MQNHPYPAGMWRSVFCPMPASIAQVLQALKHHHPHLIQEPAPWPRHFGAKIPLADGAPHEGWELIEFPGKGYLTICDCDFREDRSELVPYEKLTEFHYSLSGTASVFDRGESTAAAELSVIACKAGSDATYRVTCNKGPRRSVALHLHDEFLETLLEEHSEENCAIRSELAGVAPTDVYFRSLSINQRILNLVIELLNNPHQGTRRWMYAEAKSTELLLETLEHWHAQQSSSASRLTLKPRDIALIENARQRILDNLKSTPSIPQLARLVGTNTAKLTAGFKMLYGTTVHQFTLKARMEHALHLLTTEGASVGDVAEAVGYQYQSSFTLAFTRYFHFLPSRAYAMSTQQDDPAGNQTTALPTEKLRKS